MLLGANGMLELRCQCGYVALGDTALALIFAITATSHNVYYVKL